METFLNSARNRISGLPGFVEREQLLETVRRQGLPTTSDEVWRYAPLAQFSIDDFGSPESEDISPSFIQELTQHAEIVVRVENGVCVNVAGAMSGVAVGHVDSWSVDATEYIDDSFALLNTSLHHHVVSIDVDADVNAGSILVIHHIGRGASFPRTRVTLGRSASVTVIEVCVGGRDARLGAG